PVIALDQRVPVAAAAMEPDRAPQRGDRGPLDAAARVLDPARVAEPVHARPRVPVAVEPVVAGIAEHAAVVLAAVLANRHVDDLALAFAPGQVVRGQELQVEGAAAAAVEIAELGPQLQAAAAHPAR